MQLNEAQRRAVNHDSGPLIVLAGPGTGKTRVITARIERLIRQGADPETILAMTFTVKAAEEMRERIAERIGMDRAARLRMGTFHGYGRRLLLRFGDRIGMPEEQRLMDSAQSRRLIRGLIFEHDLFADRAGVGRSSVITQAQQFIEQCRNEAVAPQQALEYMQAWGRRLADNADGLDDVSLAAERARQPDLLASAQLFVHYQQRIIEEGLVTFDDYLALPVVMMDRSEAAASIIHSEVQHLVVDEFQDVNRAQIEFLKRLAPPRPGADVCVVGDDDQAIYAFRGSDQLAFQHFEKTWSGCTTIALEENYRSTPRILSLASDFISRTDDRFDPDKVVRPGLEHADFGPEIEAITHRRHGDASASAAAFILEDRAENPHKSWSSYAVIARTNTELERCATVLELHGIPYAFRRTPSLLQDEGIRDLMAWLKLISDPMETWEAFRILVRPPFSFPLEEVSRWHDGWRRESGRARFAQAEGDDFLAWAAKRRPDLDALRRLKREVEQLREYDASHRADETMYETIRRMGAADLDPLEPRRRERRIRNLAEILRFACDALDNLDPPGNLEAFWSYYNDMDHSGQEFRLESHAQLDIDDDVAMEEKGEDQRTGGAVSLITAHGAKGLEFDTVCIVRVRRPHGFPKTRGGRDDAEPLPTGLTGKEAIDDLTEERRLFYVAMTRAERRLALVAEERKVEKNDCFFGHIALHAAKFGVRIRTEAEMIEQAVRAAGESLTQLDPLVAQSAAAGLLSGRSDAAESLDREQRSVRERLYGALHAAASGDLDLETLHALQAQVSEDAARLAILGALEHRVAGPDELPAWVESLSPELKAFAADMMKDVKAASAFEWKGGMKAPLSLSYTMLNQYRRCPACFYLQYIMGLRGPTSPALAFGDVVHRTLEEFYTRHRAAMAEGGVPPDREWLIEHGRNRYIQSVPRYMPEDVEVMDRLAAQLGSAWDDFHSSDIDVLEIEKRIDQIPLVVDGETHHLVAKIDRIDTIEMEGHQAFRIVDYKTGKARDDIVKPEGDDLQMAIYALALQHHFEMEDLPRGVAEYWVLATGQRGQVRFDALDLKKVRSEIDEAVRGMLSDQFKPGRNCRNGVCGLLGVVGRH